MAAEGGDPEARSKCLHEMTKEVKSMIRVDEIEDGIGSSKSDPGKGIRIQPAVDFFIQSGVPGRDFDAHDCSAVIRQICRKAVRKDYPYHERFPASLRSLMADESAEESSGVKKTSRRAAGPSTSTKIRARAETHTEDVRNLCNTSSCNNCVCYIETPANRSKKDEMVIAFDIQCDMSMGAILPPMGSTLSWAGGSVSPDSHTYEEYNPKERVRGKLVFVGVPLEIVTFKYGSESYSAAEFQTSYRVISTQIFAPIQNRFDLQVLMRAPRRAECICGSTD
eukprot:SAG11_NODE_238_length_11818_cov_2.367693_8_plen_280_part_00